MFSRFLFATSLAQLASGTPVASSDAPNLPCDIYGAAGTPCIAAHSTTRALYKDHYGRLYRVMRDSDNAGYDVWTLNKGGVADAVGQDSFCDGTTCVISIIYDQSPNENHLTQAPPGGFNGPEPNHYDNLASAIGAPVTLNGQRAYGVFVSPGTGYRHNSAKGAALGDAAEGMYAVFDGTHTNGKCCFDYGNAESNSQDTGNGHMEAIYFGDINGMGNGKGSGPWVMADLENGIFAGDKDGLNPGVPSTPYRFVTAVIKGKPGHWAVRGANSAADKTMSTYFDGARPVRSGYNPMHKEGGIILGIGGDNSNSGQGTFYEGCMTSGYPTDAAEDAVQANIASMGYADGSYLNGSTIAVGSTVSFRATTACCTTTYIGHGSGTDTTLTINGVDGNSSPALKQAVSWRVRQGLGNAGCLSFESVDRPGSFIRHSDYQLHADQNDGSKLFHEDATFCSLEGFHGTNTNAIRSWSYATRYWRHYNGTLYIARNGGEHEWDTKTYWLDDASWAVGPAWAS